MAPCPRQIWRQCWDELSGFFKRPDFGAGLEAWRAQADAVLLDVRTAEEYGQGHIEGSLNIPLQNIQAVESAVPALDKPIYVHCLSGSRSAQAASILKSMGYTNVTNIGGIGAYRGKVVR